MTNPFANWSMMDVARHESRVAKTLQEAFNGADPGKEAELHNEIIDECRRRGFVAFHGAMSERTHRTEGEPDFICMLPGGITAFVEAKTRTGKLSPAQSAIQAWARKLGHRIYVVRSIEDFRALARLLLSDKDRASNQTTKGGTNETTTGNLPPAGEVRDGS